MSNVSRIALDSCGFGRVGGGRDVSRTAAIRGEAKCSSYGILSHKSRLCRSSASSVSEFNESTPLVPTASLSNRPRLA